jgi:hypothetical protein
MGNATSIYTRFASNRNLRPLPQENTAPFGLSGQVYGHPANFTQQRSAPSVAVRLQQIYFRGSRK